MYLKQGFQGHLCYPDDLNRLIKNPPLWLWKPSVHRHLICYLPFITLFSDEPLNDALEPPIQDIVFFFNYLELFNRANPIMTDLGGLGLKATVCFWAVAETQINRTLPEAWCVHTFYYFKSHVCVILCLWASRITCYQNLESLRSHGFSSTNPKTCMEKSPLVHHISYWKHPLLLSESNLLKADVS